MKSCSRSYRLHVSFCSAYCCIHAALRGLSPSLFLCFCDCQRKGLREVAGTGQGVRDSGLGIRELESCVTKWGKRYKVLIKIVFSCACYYKGACSQVGYRLGLQFRQGIGIEDWECYWWRGHGGWPGWAASHHSSCLCMHIKVKISNGDNDKGTHSCAELSWAEQGWAGLGWSGLGHCEWIISQSSPGVGAGFAAGFRWVSLVCFPYGKQKAGGGSRQGVQCFHWC